jgi:hypothetical protein
MHHRHRAVHLFRCSFTQLTITLSAIPSSAFDKEAMYIDTFCRSRLDFSVVDIVRDIGGDNYVIKSPFLFLVTTSNFLTSSSQETLRVEEASHPVGDRAGSIDP